MSPIFPTSVCPNLQAPTPKVKTPKPAAATPTTLAAATTPVAKKEKKRKQKDGEATPAAAEPVAGAEKKVSHPCDAEMRILISRKRRSPRIRMLLFVGIGLSLLCYSRYKSLSLFTLYTYAMQLVLAMTQGCSAVNNVTITTLGNTTPPRVHHSIQA